MTELEKLALSLVTELNNNRALLERLKKTEAELERMREERDAAALRAARRQREACARQFENGSISLWVSKLPQVVVRETPLVTE